MPPDEGGESEDCLHLNVWTPAMRDGKKRPVMVYFHGGGYTYGTVNSVLYDGNRLAHRGDVVVVTVNGRLNAFGFLYLAELGGAGFEDSGMAGQLDLVLALRWIRENIAEFGGDASRGADLWAVGRRREVLDPDGDAASEGVVPSRGLHERSAYRRCS